MAFDKSRYDQEYNKQHITRKFIPFNDTVQDDAILLEWLAARGNVTQYVKRLIRQRKPCEFKRSHGFFMSRRKYKKGHGSTFSDVVWLSKWLSNFLEGIPQAFGFRFVPFVRDGIIDGQNHFCVSVTHP